MENKKIPITESTIFMFLLTWVGGFMDAYTCVTRGGVFANTQTTNLAKIGVELSIQNWSGALDAFIPVVASILGSMSAEAIRNRKYLNPKLNSDRMLLIANASILVMIGFMPTSVPNGIVNFIASLVTALQLNSFRKWHGAAHNTTISTGNVRSIGQNFYSALTKRDKASASKAAVYFCIVFAFSFGALVGALTSYGFSVKSVWICSGVLMFLLYLLVKEEKQGA